MSLYLSRARTLFHRDLIGSKTLSVDSAGIASNADKSQKLSCELALGIAR
ncbi:NgoMIV family type II restriction endonuclease, partial [Pauljensenia sp. UMB3104]